MEIKFTNTIPAPLTGYHPVPSSKSIPDWYKEIPSYRGEGLKKPFNGANPGTIKRCMPVFDAISSGYIIPTYSDVFVSQKTDVFTHDETGQEYESEEKFPWYEWPTLEPVAFHDVNQAPNHPNRNGHRIYPKWNNPWAIQTPKGYSCLFIPPMHHPNNIFSILPGVVDTDTYTAPVNFPFVLTDITFEGLIPAGTPMVQVIPFKRDSWEMTFGDMSDIKKSANLTVDLRSSWFDSYKTKWRQPKEYK